MHRTVSAQHWNGADDESAGSRERGSDDAGAGVRAGSGSSSHSPRGIYHDVARLIERMHRRFLDVIRVELARLRIDDISPVQVLILINIGAEELSVRDLIERGHYLGSNASYNLKQLLETGYIDRGQSQRDRRTARLKLSEKGVALYAELRRLEVAQAETIIRSQSEEQDLDTTYRTLRRLERAWSDIVRYDGRNLDE